MTTDDTTPALASTDAPDQPTPRDERRAALESGPLLRDVDSAVNCSCSCHPRPAQHDLHDGGASCSCQATPEERREAFGKFLESMRDLGLEDAFAQDRADFDAAAAELGVTARIRVSACPLIVTGTVDGCGFYFRERHERFAVSVPEDLSTVDLYDNHDAPTTRVTSGSGALRPADALRTAVTAVRDHLRAASCLHPDARAFCPDCGLRTGA